MAQMVAKAMAKNPTGASKAELDRLAAEFRDELENLGVRVAELEKYADKVVWHGELRYRYWSDKEDLKGGGDRKTTSNQLQLRFLPTATVNDHWKLKARMDGTANMSTDESGDFKLKKAFAEGVYGKFTIQVGKFDFYTNVDDGLVMDDFLSGAAVVYGDKFKVALMAGRWSGTDSDYKDADGNVLVKGDPASYQGGEISYDNDKFYIGAGYHHFKSDYFRNLHTASAKAYKDTDSANVWTVGARYNFDFGLKVRGAYAQNAKAKEYKRSWTAGLAYKGADKKNAGTWGISADYRYVSDNVSLAPTYDTWFGTSHKKGIDLGIDWTPIDNTYVKIGYFTGKTLDTKEDDKTFFSRVSWFF